MDKPRVLIVIGSDSDVPVMEEGAKVLRAFGVPFDMRISSAHRSPERTAALRPGLRTGESASSLQVPGLQLTLPAS